MPQTFSNLLAHVIYSTKDRAPLITSEIKPRLYAYVGGIARELESTLLAAAASRITSTCAAAPWATDSAPRWGSRDTPTEPTPPAPPAETPPRSPP